MAPSSSTVARVRPATRQGKVSSVPNAAGPQFAPSPDCPSLLTRRGASAGHPPRKPGSGRRGGAHRDVAGRVSSEGEPGFSRPSTGEPQAEGLSGGDEAGKGPISLLQEFVQCSKQFHAAPHRQILQWSFDQRMVHSTTLEFRALVAFVLDGVPHHVAGAWRLSKKLAQRDAAERALGFFVTAWGEALLQEDGQAVADAPVGCSGPAAGSARGGAGPVGGEAQAPPECGILEEFCSRAPMCGGPARPRWSASWDGGRCRATVEVEILGVVHKFAGAHCATHARAQADAARRVLWYLRCPGFESIFELDQTCPAMTGRDIPLPPTNWASDDSENDAIHNAERRTVVMRAQNRLQQVFAGQLRPGQGVWEWTYETDDHDLDEAPRCRATVCIPAAGRSFTGCWESNQREAQIAVSQQVVVFLDAWEDQRGRGGASVPACSGRSN